MLSYLSNLNTEETIAPFSLLDEDVGQKQRNIIQFVKSMAELKYVTLNDNNQLELTNSGRDYIRRHGHKYPTYIEQLSNNNIISTAKRINDLGEEVDDYNHVKFKTNAPEDIVWPTVPFSD